MKTSNYVLLVPMIAAILFVSGCTSTAETTANPIVDSASGDHSMNETTPEAPAQAEAADAPADIDAGAKVFYMDSFYVMEDGKPRPQFSVKELSVNKGDKVVIYVNTTKGTHDFKIDELGVYSATPTGEVTRIEFVAGEAGEFVYYCSMPNHRANGHWGTLKVSE